MKMQAEGETLRISELKELGTANSGMFRQRVKSALNKGLRTVEIDLSETQYLDGCGLGALISLQRLSESRNGAVRLKNPRPQVQQILELTRMDEYFQILTE